MLQLNYFSDCSVSRYFAFIRYLDNSTIFHAKNAIQVRWNSYFASSRGGTYMKQCLLAQSLPEFMVKILKYDCLLLVLHKQNTLWSEPLLLLFSLFLHYYNVLTSQLIRLFTNTVPVKQRNRLKHRNNRVIKFYQMSWSRLVNAANTSYHAFLINLAQLVLHILI